MTLKANKMQARSAELKHGRLQLIQTYTPQTRFTAKSERLMAGTMRPCNHRISLLRLQQNEDLSKLNEQKWLECGDSLSAQENSIAVCTTIKTLQATGTNL